MRSFLKILFFIVIQLSVYQESLADLNKKNYLKVSGGFSKFFDDEFINNKQVQNSFNPSVSLSFGHYVNNKFSLSLNSNIFFTSGGFYFNDDNEKVTVKYNIHDFIARLTYDLVNHDYGNLIYCGAGIGLSRVSYLDDHNISFYNTHNQTNNFVFEGFIGSSIELSDRVSFDIEFKYKYNGKLKDTNYKLQTIVTSGGIRISF